METQYIQMIFVELLLLKLRVEDSGSLLICHLLPSSPGR